ncbi:MAG: cbb3-type cytochrome oxidase assembly protein CcoS [Paracoccaceae bacterium]|nr:cbb3-type cytochrome oxidase assembly protein CcoS [Paracoccaceae bacterium]
MTVLGALIPISLFLGLCGLGAFVWTLRARQYEDLEGDQHRTLFGGHDDGPM